MEITHEHRKAATALVHRTPPAHYVAGPEHPAVASFLAAIERLSEDEPTVDTGLISVAHVDFTDTSSDEGRIGTNGHSVSIEMAEGSEMPLSTHSPCLFLSPDEAERRGWELIALAHLARKEG